MSHNQKKGSVLLPVRVLQGVVIGLGAVLPGISGGVLGVIFGIYKPIMELLSHPVKNFRTHVPELLPVITGGIIGFLGVANMLAFFLEKYPDPSVCVFVGLITGMLPSLFREAGEKGRSRGSFLAMLICMAGIFALLIGLRMTSVQVETNFLWFLFSGFCLALSVIAPGMSFSTLLMPLGLYTPFVEGIGHFDMGILVPGAIGAVVTVICLSKVVNTLFENFYSVAFHGIIGIVIAATVMTIPFSGFQNVESIFINMICIITGVIAALILDCFNSRIKAV